MVVFGGVRALVVFPELAVAGGAAGAGSASAVPPLEVPEAPLASLFPFDSRLLALVVLPEFAADVGSVAAVPPEVAEPSVDFFDFALLDFVRLAEFSPLLGADVSPLCVLALDGVSLEVVPPAALFDFSLLDADLCSPCAGVDPVGGVALAAGSAAALFFGLLFTVGSSLAVVSPAAAFLDSLFFEEAPVESFAEAFFLLVELSVPTAAPESSAFVDFFFFEVESVSLDAESDVSSAGFFFFFLAVVAESLCV